MYCVLCGLMAYVYMCGAEAMAVAMTSRIKLYIMLVAKLRVILLHEQEKPPTTMMIVLRCDAIHTKYDHIIIDISLTIINTVKKVNNKKKNH